MSVCLCVSVRPCFANIEIEQYLENEVSDGFEILGVGRKCEDSTLGPEKKNVRRTFFKESQKSNFS